MDQELFSTVDQLFPFDRHWKSIEINYYFVQVVMGGSNLIEYKAITLRLINLINMGFILN